MSDVVKVGGEHVVLAPQPSTAISAGKGWRAAVTASITFIVWEVGAELLPLLTPDVIEGLLGRVLIAYPKLAMAKGVLFVVLMGIVKGLQNQLQVRREAMTSNRSVPGVETVTQPPPAILIKGSEVKP